jgi:hypothetical protein
LLREQVCDADPYLLRAAKHHGEETERVCPMCAKSELVHVTYIFGDDLGYLSGRVKTTSELKVLAYEYGHFRVYVVEVCKLCAFDKQKDTQLPNIKFTLDPNFKKKFRNIPIKAI